MNNKTRFVHLRKMAAVGALAGSLGFLAGCGTDSGSTSEGSKPAVAATGPASKVPALPAGVSLKEEDRIQGYWVSEGFKVRNYDGVQIEPTVFAANMRDNEVEMRAMAMRALPEKLATKFRELNVFTNVTQLTSQATGTIAGKTLRMQNYITEYSQGGNVGRAFGGVFGAGQPVIRVRGMLFDGEKPVFVYDLKRSGESDESKFLGAGKGNEEIQREDIDVLARDLAGLLLRTAGS